MLEPDRPYLVYLGQPVSKDEDELQAAIDRSDAMQQLPPPLNENLLAVQENAAKLFELE